ncbi:hypothetical protein B0H14DRAFT_3575545 [Mycena olivaceomarginata]|nr:hypothetical protein B0H14DRAFT_3575545 [Mycena olivaceomarginata]
MNEQAEIHLVKSEYDEAYNIQTQIFQDCPVHMDPNDHAYALLNLAELDLYLREGDILAAEALFKQCLALSNSEIKSFCLEQLGNTSRWFLGDIFLNRRDEDMAVNLFTIALEGLTYMDVHRSRAECMLRLGDIAKEHDDLRKAVESWDAARPLFEWSSQIKGVELIDKRLGSVGEDFREQHRMNLARLVVINAPAGILEDAEVDLSDIEEEEDLSGVEPFVAVWKLG